MSVPKSQSSPPSSSNVFAQIHDKHAFAAKHWRDVELALSEFLKGEGATRTSHGDLAHWWQGAVKARILSLIEQARASFVGRDLEIEAVAAAFVSGVSVLLLGPPGTAKSAVVRRMVELCGVSDTEPRQYFEYLLTNHTMPEELFGGPELSKLAEGKFVRRTTNKLPEAQIAFLDELFRGGSHILNTLLTLINEKLYDAGGDKGAEHVPLLALVGASNYAPLDQELEAFFDRFPIRVWVESVMDTQGDDDKRDSKVAQAIAQHMLHSESQRLVKAWDRQYAAAALQHVLESSTNDFRVARVKLLVDVRRTLDGQRFREFERMFRSVRDRCRLSDRSFGYLYLFGAALDLVRGKNPINATTDGAEPSTGHIDVFRLVARSRSEIGYLRDCVENFHASAVTVSPH